MIFRRKNQFPRLNATALDCPNSTDPNVVMGCGLTCPGANTIDYVSFDGKKVSTEREKVCSRDPIVIPLGQVVLQCQQGRSGRYWIVAGPGDPSVLSFVAIDLFRESDPLPPNVIMEAEPQ